MVRYHIHEGWVRMNSYYLWLFLVLYLVIIFTILVRVFQKIA